MPSSRIGRSRSILPSTVSAAAATTDGSVVGPPRSFMLRIGVKNDRYRTFTATCVTRRPSATTSAHNVRAISDSRAATSAGSPTSVSKVTSWPRERATHGSVTMCVSPPPRAMNGSNGARRGPNTGSSTSGSVAASAPTVDRPRASSFLAVFGPTPCRAATGRAAINDDQFADVISKIPAGLPNCAAIFAWCLLCPMPIVQASPLAARTAACRSAASACGSAISPPRYASSQPHTSTPPGSSAGCPSRWRMPRRTRRGRSGGTRRPRICARPPRAACPIGRRRRAPRTTRSATT